MGSLFDDVINQSVNNQPLVLVITFVGLLVVFMLVGAVFMGGEQATKRRIKSLSARREELYKSRMRTEKGRVSLKEKNTLARRLFHKKSMDKEEQMSALQAQLSQAGYRDRGSVYTYQLFRMALTVAIPILFYTLSKIYLPTVSIGVSLLIAVVGLYIGYRLPSFYLDWIIKKRQRKITRAFPDAIDMLVVSAEAGLGMDAALKRVTNEMFSSSPEMSEELAVLLVELSFFDNRETAFKNFAKRVRGQQSRSFSTTLTQTEKFGTSVAQSFRILSDEFRKDRINAAEIKANSLTVKMSIPMMLFIFLPLIVLIAAPAVIGINENITFD